MIDSLDQFFEDGVLQEYVKSKVNDPWRGTNFEGYLNLSATQMGAFGETLVTKIMKNLGSTIEPRINPGHDKIIDGYKTEIKFSLSLKENHFSFNHIATHKDWDRIILLGVNPNNKFHMNWIYKKDFVDNINSDACIFRRQQGGGDGKNDDFMYTIDFLILKNMGITQEMDSWLKDGRKLLGIELWL